MGKKKITMEDVPLGQIPSAKSADSKTEKKEHTVNPLIADDSKYHLKEDDTFMLKFGILSYEGRWRIVDFERLEDVPEAEEHWAKVKMCPYGLQNWIKEKATTFDRVTRMHKYDADLSNRIKIQRLLIDWSFSKEDERCKIHHVQGVMSDESYAMFERMQPNIINHIITRMNEILEYNG